MKPHQISREFFYKRKKESKEGRKEGRKERNKERKKERKELIIVKANFSIILRLDLILA